jgi:predicted metal-dependent hydrolase
LKKEAKEYIKTRVAKIAEENGFKYNNIRITSAKTRWGSCSSRKNLNFSFYLI